MAPKNSSSAFDVNVPVLLSPCIGTGCLLWRADRCTKRVGNLWIFWAKPQSDGRDGTITSGVRRAPKRRNLARCRRVGVGRSASGGMAWAEPLGCRQHVVGYIRRGADPRRPDPTHIVEGTTLRRKRTRTHSSRRTTREADGFASSATTGSAAVVKRPSTTLMRAARRQSTPNSPAGYTPAGGRRLPAIPAYPRVAAMPPAVSGQPIATTAPIRSTLSWHQPFEMRPREMCQCRT